MQFLFKMDIMWTKNLERKFSSATNLMLCCSDDKNFFKGHASELKFHDP